MIAFYCFSVYFGLNLTSMKDRQLRAFINVRSEATHSRSIDRELPRWPENRKEDEDEED
jgi:hypothetical protein